MTHFLTTSFLTTSRMTFHYRSHGSPDGMPMLLLHGSFGSSRWWEPFLALLPEEIYAIAPDLRGCGQSDPQANPDSYEIAEQARDIHSLVEALGWRDIDMVGHSSGGAIAMEFALTSSELLSTLTLVDSVPIEGVYTPPEALTLLDQLQSDRELLAQSLALLMPSYLAPKTDPHALDADPFFRHLVEDATQMDPPLFTELAQALGRWNRFADAGALTLPSLLIWGELDEIVSRDAVSRTLIALPGANNLEVLRGVGHSPMIEAPLTLAERIIEFITEDYGYFESVRHTAE